MKAIHNYKWVEDNYLLTVVNKAKIQNESNSQPVEEDFDIDANCCQQSKDTK